MLSSLTLVTSNLGKVQQLSRALDFPVRHENIDLIEIQSLDVAEIVEYKAREAYKHIQAPVLVEDTSLQFLALGKLPGPLVKWFLAELGTHGLCHLLDASMDRSAVATVQLGFYDGHSFQAFTGTREGTISLHPRGSNGFGWDAIFIPSGYQKTWAEMTPEEGQETSMRTLALKKFEAYLKTR
ncbi:non-canonical purine NTP pyrophosphatase [Dictyobacter alpinus]|uniref:Non-canonical purine NTP pyrophosphatase n=1 Tax=Dictyobacter alpinus TaxID=2014873 RepID=A0A402BF27_9CHLR|nr:non-canonical purine NTP pyrophosphatase [Dictyobacter alpinus]GCE29975.1 non-canonical purine NTP pyrophosphatase [Dictyobacter alpinus]